MSPEKYRSLMLWRTEASLRQVRSAMSSCLSYLGGFIFCMSSLLTSILLLVSTISTSTSSPWFFFMEAATKPWVSWGTQTSLFWDHSAWVAGSEKAFLSTTRNLRSGSDLSTSPMMLGHWALAVTCWYQMSSKSRVLNSHYWVWYAVCQTVIPSLILPSQSETEQWMGWVSKKFQMMVLGWVLGDMGDVGRGGQAGWYWAVTTGTEVLGWTEQSLAGGPWPGGSRARAVPTVTHTGLC